jgi:hypothetical protein
MTDKLYPALPAENSKIEDYRLNAINALKHKLENEVEIRKTIRNKYKRAVNILSGVQSGLATVGLVMGGTSAGLLLTVVGVPVSMGLGIAGSICGALAFASKSINTKLLKKAEKHDEIRMLAMAKLNSIANKVSTALQDGSVSDEEFKLIIGEMDKYQQMKADVRKPIQFEISAEEKKTIREQIRTDMLKSIGGR